MGDAPSPLVLYFDPKKTTENFARLCQFLVTICSDVLRDILSHYIKPANLRTELDKNRSKLEKITNLQEKDSLYPPHSSANVPQIKSSNFDISLLYKILRNICNIPTHKAGWGNQPVPDDFSLSACIERIRILRNAISGHSTNGAVDDVEFEQYWNELQKCVLKIEREVIGSNKYEMGINHLYDCDLNPTKSKEYVAQIRKNTGEIIMKRERIDLIEEEANTKRVKLENLEKRQSDLEARLTESLKAVKSEILKELKATEQRLQQERANTRETSSYITSKSTTTIKFKSAVLGKTNASQFSMHSTRDNKCWLLVPFNLFAVESALSSDTETSSKLYLLSEVDVVKEIKIQQKYDIQLFLTNITTNEDGDVVFVSGRSLVAVGEKGEFRELFNIAKDYKPTYWNVCCIRSGNYVIGGRYSEHFFEYNREGTLLQKWNLPATSCPYVLNINQNNNQNFILTRPAFFGKCILVILDKSFNLKCTVNLECKGKITMAMNDNSDLLFGHGQSIDLLDERGRFVKTVYKKHRHGEIINIAYCTDGTVWILYDSFEIDVFKLEIPR